MRVYEKVFDENIQSQMKEFFLELAMNGRKKKLNKKEQVIFDPKLEFGVVIEGKVGETFISKQGDQKEMFYLTKGEVFGELNFLEEYPLDTMVYAIEESTIAIVNGRDLIRKFEEDWKNFRYVYHSLFRKYQIAKFQMLNLVFADSLTNVCDTLVRIAISTKDFEDGKPVIKFTHQHLSDLIGCNRITVTKALNYLKEQGIINTVNKNIIIEDLEALKEIISNI